MESLESKLDRLTAEQRKEVEDFVDFLMFRSGSSHESPLAAAVTPLLQDAALPILTPPEPVRFPEHSPGKGFESPSDESLSLFVETKEQSVSFNEIIVGGDDHVTHGYLDYGQFEQKSSPAITAVKNVKEKLQKQKEQEKPRVLLDWID